PDRAESELEASVDRLFDEGGSATDTVAEDVVSLQPRHQRKRKTVVVDASEASHPPKKLREDYGTPSGPSIAGKSRFVISLDSSHHSGTNVAEAELLKRNPLNLHYFFAASSSAGGTDPTLGGFLDCAGSDFLVGGIRTVIDPDTDL
ncbi:hypothetical protein Tco_0118613, partial [Tanacetum coccineum]